MEITPENIDEVRETLIEKGGRILSTGVGFDLSMDLYDKPSITPQGYISVERGKEDRNGVEWQTGWENDRGYTLQQRQESRKSIYTTCDNLAENLVIGSSVFRIGFQPSISSEILFHENFQYLYVPQTKSLEDAFSESILFGIGRLDKLFPQRGYKIDLDEDQIKKIVDYTMLDLETGQVFHHNVQAGLESDGILGLS